jgi:hypothetical protein
MIGCKWESARKGGANKSLDFCLFYLPFTTSYLMILGCLDVRAWSFKLRCFIIVIVINDVFHCYFDWLLIFIFC